MKAFEVASRVMLLAGAVFAGATSFSKDVRSLEAGRTFYVDFDSGSNSASGLSPSEAWRMAPGDPVAEGGPSAVRLRPGDVIVFKAGVIYRGSIRIPASGEPARPIIYRGAGWSSGKAVISGRDRVTITLTECGHSAKCPEPATPGRLLIADLPTSISPYAQVVLAGKQLSLAQMPKPVDPFWFDDIRQFYKLPKNELASKEQHWQIGSWKEKALLHDAPLYDLLVFLWGMPNVIYTAAPVSDALHDGGLLLAVRGFKPYRDRDARFALANHPRALSNDGEYVTLKEGRQLLIRGQWPARETVLETSQRLSAFDLNGQSDVVIENFRIEGFAGGPGQWRGGVALFSSQPGASRIAFAGNEIQDLTSWAGSGAVNLNGISELQLGANHFVRLRNGSGIRISGNSHGITIAGNIFEKIGRTGIALIGSQDVKIEGNRFSELHGLHGNGIAVYLDNHRIEINNNLIRDTARPITFHGSGELSTHPNNISIHRNLIWGTGVGNVGIQSWGNMTNQVSIEQNMILSDRGHGIGLHFSDRGMRIRNNIIDGLVINGAPPADWDVSGNLLTRGTAYGPYLRMNTLTPGARADVIDAFKNGRSETGLCKVLNLADSAGAGVYSEVVIGPDQICKTEKPRSSSVRN